MNNGKGSIIREFYSDTTSYCFKLIGYILGDNSEIESFSYSMINEPRTSKVDSDTQNYLSIMYGLELEGIDSGVLFYDITNGFELQDIDNLIRRQSKLKKLRELVELAKQVPGRVRFKEQERSL